MISIIICSRTPNISNKLKANITHTIGTRFEIVIIDNSLNQHTIFSAYNKGFEQSKYPFLCFIHEDILFHTDNWGEVLINYFNSIPHLGAVGIAGSIYKTKAPSAWWDVDENSKVRYLIQHSAEKEKKLDNDGWMKEESYKEVAVIDGVFMFVKKSLGINFDTKLPGFHCYDLYLSLEVAIRNSKLIVTRELLVEHYSSGNVNKGWIKATHLLHKKYRGVLPIKGDISLANYEIYNLKNFITLSAKFGFYKIALYYWKELFLLKPFSLHHFQILKKLLQIH